MFVRVKKIAGYEYLYLVENAREGGRHVQRMIKALGRRDEVAASGMLDSLIASAARHSRRSIVLSSFYRGELAPLRQSRIVRAWSSAGCGKTPVAVTCSAACWRRGDSPSMSNGRSISPWSTG